MEKIKTLTIGGVTYGVCQPMTEEEKQEVTGRVLEGIDYEQILLPHKDQITQLAAQELRQELHTVTRALGKEDFAPGRINVDNMGFLASTNSVATEAFLPCTYDEPYAMTVNESDKTKLCSVTVVYYIRTATEERVVGYMTGLMSKIDNLLNFGKFLNNDALAANQKNITHIRIMITCNETFRPVDAQNNFDTVVQQFSFSRRYSDGYIRSSQLAAALENRNALPFVPKVLFLGDSITAGSAGPSWTEPFLEKLGGQQIANVAVGGAVLADKNDNPYDGDPQTGQDNNVLGNQVQKIIKEGYAAPDIIMIAIGTNGGIKITEEQLAEAYGIKLEKVDKKTDAGAFRYVNETLRQAYPNAVIFWCSPIHSAQPDRLPRQVCSWNAALQLATAYTGMCHIDTLRCGIASVYEKQGEEGQCLKDGLHPNATGAKRMGMYNARCVLAAMC